MINIININERRELAPGTAAWFHEKWGVPREAYLESITEAFKEGAKVPQWYAALDGEKIVAGLGVIENDFHDRSDLTPNVCAVYVEKAYRCQGIAGQMLRFACDDMSARGISTLYLLTDHTAFYERYGWQFLCMVQGDGEEKMSRMYVHKRDKSAGGHA